MIDVEQVVRKVRELAEGEDSEAAIMAISDIQQDVLRVHDACQDALDKLIGETWVKNEEEHTVSAVEETLVEAKPTSTKPGLGLCFHCAFWGDERSLTPPFDGLVNICTRIRHIQDADISADRAFLVDAERYHADLWSKADFGCTYFQIRNK